MYYYYIDKKDIDEKIKEIYYMNKGRYSYSRITLELKIKISILIIKKYKDQVGKITDNNIKKD